MDEHLGDASREDILQAVFIPITDTVHRSFAIAENY